MSTEQEEQAQTINQALNLLVQGVQVAQKRGAYNLSEAAILSRAVDALVTPTNDPAPFEEDETSEENSETPVEN
jgi:hypothetical protein